MQESGMLTMELYCTYIETDKFDEVINFYETIFQTKGNIGTKNRWIEFDFGNKLSIYNRLYDVEQIKNNNTSVSYNEQYINNFQTSKEQSFNNIITLNFYTTNLKEEYNRIKKLNLCKVSEIIYVNINTKPYYYFNIYDPEGNTIEIYGDKFDE